jgi:hypothetical protein
VTDVIVVAYLLGWALTSGGLAILSRWLGSRRGPAPHPVAVSILAGAVWPFLLLGVVEFGAVVAASKVVHDDEAGMAFIS